jgi:aspartyl-tRNA(Asn)/glutamyl-tRNA(Gln) amidotransferase subunit A
MGEADRMTAIEIAASVRAGERSAREVVDEHLARIDGGNGPLNAFVHVDEDGARSTADGIDARVAAGEDPGPFAGVPFGVKDLEDCAGMPTSHGSAVYAERPPVDRDSVHVARLRAAGAVPVGKTAAPEFGTLNFTRTIPFGTTRSPWGVDRTPGGSSGGSAAAVAAGLVPVATASDGGGSTRIPASFSGLVGMKPSHGRIPSPGPSGSQTAVLGLLTTTVTESARHLDLTSGPDGRDRLSLPAPTVGYEDLVESLDVAGLRVRWSSDLGFAVTDPDVAGICRAAAEALVDAADLEVDESPVDLGDPVRLWFRAGAADLWLDLEKGMWPGVADELTPFVRRALEMTDDYTVPRYAEVLRLREVLQEHMAAVFEEVDAVLCPATAVPAFQADGPPPTVIDGREVGMGMATPYTMPANLCWNPAVSVPAGLTGDGLPVGLQIIAPRHRDEVPLRLARILEQTRPWPRHAA